MPTKNSKPAASKPTKPSYDPANDRVLGRVLIVHLNPDGSRASGFGEGVESLAIACRSFTGTNEDGTPSAGEPKISVSTAFVAKKTSTREGWSRYRVNQDGSTVLENPTEGRVYIGAAVGRLPVKVAAALMPLVGAFAGRVAQALDAQTKAA